MPISKYKIVYKYNSELTNYSSVVCAKTGRVIMNDLMHGECEAYIDFLESN
jgi:hypothetical protein